MSPSETKAPVTVVVRGGLGEGKATWGISLAVDAPSDAQTIQRGTLLVLPAGAVLFPFSVRAPSHTLAGRPLCSGLRVPDFGTILRVVKALGLELHVSAAR